ncbi:MAG: type II toxin-antitoxin system Phd/YefM family antitoxin [Deltaproteobacteria bacterium]|nr:type II toxin-antitoxin system Phd/YefM family antitoxin [Deltaproteobacteria bacterium]
MASRVPAVGVAELKRRFSEYLDRVLHGGERVVVHRRGREVAALVPAGDAGEAPVAHGRGLLAAIGAWEDADDVDAVVRHIYRARRRSKDRRVPRI